MASDGIENSVLSRNIHSLLEVRERHENLGASDERLAAHISHLIGSLKFVYFNMLWFGGWIALNSGIFGNKPWDPYPFVVLAVTASIEAIFLSTFMLIGQNHMNKLAEKRADLDVQISLLTEHELTQLIRLTDAIARHLRVSTGDVTNLEEIKKDVAPQALLEQIEKQALDFEEGK